jgi:hypothetical protein
VQRVGRRCMIIPARACYPATVSLILRCSFVPIEGLKKRVHYR